MSVVGSMLAALVLVPALLLAFPKLFVPGAQPGCGREISIEHSQEHCLPVQIAASIKPSIETQPFVSQSDDGLRQQGDVASTSNPPSVFRRWWTMALLRMPWNILIVSVVLTVTILLGLQVANMTTSDSFFAYLGRGAETTTAFQRFVQSFGYGFTQPFRVLFVPKNVLPKAQNNTIFTEPFWSEAQAAVRRVLDDPVLNQSAHMGGPLAIQGKLSNLTVVENCRNFKPCPDHNLELFTLDFINSNATALYMMTTTTIDPSGSEGWPFYQRLLNALTDNGNQTATAHVSISVSGTGPDALDAIHTTYERFPAIGGVTVAIVVVVIAVCMRSVMAALRAGLVVAMAEAFAFGFAVLTFQRQPGIFDWTTWDALQSQGSISFIAPVVVFAVVLGVSINYEVLLLGALQDAQLQDKLKFLHEKHAMQILQADTGTRKRANSYGSASGSFAGSRNVPLFDDRIFGDCCPEYEDRFQNRLSSTPPVQVALIQVGPVVATAGGIMVLAMFGMMLSSVPVMNLIGACFVVAVAFNTFIVELIFAPALTQLVLSLWGKLGTK